MVRAEEGQQQGNLTLSSGATSKWRLLNHLVITRARHSPLDFYLFVCLFALVLGLCSWASVFMLGAVFKVRAKII